MKWLISSLWHQHRELALFLVVGIFNTGVSYVIYASLIWVGAHYTFAALGSSVLSTLFNFFSTGKLVFNNKDHSRIYRFFAMYGFIYCVNISLIHLFHYVHANYYLSGLLAVPFCAALAFVLSKHWVFAKRALA